MAGIFFPLPDPECCFGHPASNLTDFVFLLQNFPVCSDGHSGAIFGTLTLGTMTFVTMTFGTMTFGTMTFGTMTFGIVTFGTMTWGHAFHKKNCGGVDAGPRAKRADPIPDSRRLILRKN